MLFALLCGHAISDFALQSESMGLGKSRHKKPPYIPKGIREQTVWLYYLTAHAFINGGVVYLITQSQALGIAETIIHWIIDFCKTEGWINPHRDQMFHLLSKIVYCVVLGVI